VQRVIGNWLADQAGVGRASAQCGAVSLIQRFGSALNLNVHFHMLWLDGVYEPVAARPDKPHLLARGLSNKELARELSVSGNTIKTHLANLYAKLGVSRRTQALAVARTLGERPATGDHPQITPPGDGRG